MTLAFRSLNENLFSSLSPNIERLVNVMILHGHIKIVMCRPTFLFNAFLINNVQLATIDLNPERCSVYKFRIEVFRKIKINA